MGRLFLLRRPFLTTPHTHPPQPTHGAKRQQRQQNNTLLQRVTQPYGILYPAEVLYIHNNTAHRLSLSSSHHVTFYIHHLLHHTNANLRGGKYQRRRALTFFWGKERERGEGVQFSGTKRGRRAFYIPRQRGILCCQERDFSKKREEEMWDDDDGSCMIIRTRERGVNVPPSPRVVGGGGGGEDGGERNLYIFSRLSLHYHDFLLLWSFFRLSLSALLLVVFLVVVVVGKRASERASSVLLVLLPFLFAASFLSLIFLCR